MSVRVKSCAERNSKSVKSRRTLIARTESELIDAFNLFDHDKDGRVTRAEIVALVENLGGDSSCPHVQVINMYISDRICK